MYPVFLLFSSFFDYNNVEDLARLAVKNFAEVDMLMDEGSKARTVASTNISFY
jgi:hypothetical protein